MNSLPIWMWWLVGTAGTLLVLDLVIHLVYASLLMDKFLQRPAFNVVPPPQDGLIPEELLVPTTDGLTLRGGAYFPPDGNPHGLIVFCPETNGHYETVKNYLPALFEAGFAVISFSFRNEAPSDTLPSYHSTHWVTAYEVADLHAVLNFVLAQPQFAELPLGLVGVSRGAGVALAGGASRPEVGAVWSQGAFSTRALSLHYAVTRIQQFVGSWGKLIPIWHIDTTLWFVRRMAEFKLNARLVNLEELLPEWKGRPAQFISGGRDSYVPGRLSQRLCQQSGHAPDEDAWVVPGAKHNQERQSAPQEYDERLVQFFRMSLLARTPEPVRMTTTALR